MFGVNEAELAAEAARKLTLAAAAAAASHDRDEWRGAGGGAGAGGGGREGRELVLAGAGLRAVPPDVWAAGPSLARLDLSGNQVGQQRTSIAGT